MFSKLSAFLVAGVALLALAIAVHGQDERPSTPWSFGKGMNLLHWPGDGNSTPSTNAAANPSPDNSANANSTNQQPVHSAPVQSESNRRLYGPSLAVRPGVASGYAPPQGSTAPHFSPPPRATASDTLPVVTPGDAAASPSQFGRGLRDADAIGPRATPSITINPHVNSSRNSAASSTEPRSAVHRRNATRSPLAARAAGRDSAIGRH